MWKFLFLFAFSIAGILETTNASTCTSKEAFAEHCTKTLLGAVSGGRCFFSSNKTATWNDAWGQCQSQGGVGLAQIHTSAEMKLITAYMLIALQKLDLGVWVAHKHEQYSSDCWLSDLTRSGWYSDGSTLVAKLTSNNTWVRSRKRDDCSDRNGLCDHLWTKYTKFGDRGCDGSSFAVCMAVNPNQDYKMIPATCLTEVPILSSTSATVTECSVKCNDQGAWCRSFNYHTDNSACELFSWSVDDGPGKVNMTNCVHYTYVP